MPSVLGILPFPSITKKESVNFCLDRGSRLPIPKTRKPTDNTVSISAFLSGITEIVEISVRLKSKNAFYLFIILYVSSLFFLFILFLVVNMFVVIRFFYVLPKLGFDCAKIRFFFQLDEKLCVGWMSVCCLWQGCGNVLVSFLWLLSYNWLAVVLNFICAKPQEMKGESNNVLMC